MSLKDHPNFHSVKFVTDVMSSYYESLRGDASPTNCPNIQDEVVKFVLEIEDKVDRNTIRKS